MKNFKKLVLTAICLATPNIYAASVWTQVPGSANDIGIGSNGSVWIIGTDKKGNSGYGIHHWTGNGWEKISGGAVRIDVDPEGNPWVVNKQGRIWKYHVSTKKWESIVGTATDIGIGAYGHIWKIGTDPKGNYGFGVHKWTGSGWQQISGGGKRIDVDNGGNPWVVNNQGSIYKYLTGSNRWENKSTTVNNVGTKTANDIGIGQNTIWKIGKNAVGNYGYKISKWNGHHWLAPVDGAAENISVDQGGKAWVVNKQHRIYKMQ